MARSRKTKERKTKEKLPGSKRPIEQYDHRASSGRTTRTSLVTPDSDRDAPKKQYAYDPHLDPALTWAGKAEHTLSRCRRSRCTFMSASTQDHHRGRAPAQRDARQPARLALRVRR